MQVIVSYTRRFLCHQSNFFSGSKAAGVWRWL